MGVERAVTRWYLQRQSLLNEVVQLEGQLVQAQTLEQAQTASEDVGLRAAGVDATPQSQALTALTANEICQQLARTRERLKTLGPCPKPMMG
jgi:hypothetical protein